MDVPFKCVCSRKKGDISLAVKDTSKYADMTRKWDEKETLYKTGNTGLSYRMNDLQENAIICKRVYCMSLKLQ